MYMLMLMLMYMSALYPSSVFTSGEQSNGHPAANLVDIRQTTGGHPAIFQRIQLEGRDLGTGSGQEQNGNSSSDLYCRILVPINPWNTHSYLRNRFAAY